MHQFRAARDQQVTQLVQRLHTLHTSARRHHPGAGKPTWRTNTALLHGAANQQSAPANKPLFHGKFPVFPDQGPGRSHWPPQQDVMRLANLLQHAKTGKH
jgi:hypothetical protein